MSYKCALIVFAAAIVMSGAAIADIPFYLSYQGRLLNDSGQPVEGSFELVFSLFEGETVTTATWQEAQVVNVVDGNFQVLLGSVEPLAEEVFKSGDPIWLEVAMAKGDRAPQRFPIVSVPYAYRAARADTTGFTYKVADNSVRSGQIADGSIDLDDLGQNGATVGQVIKWSASGWSVANDSTGTGGDGDITAVTAGAGLSGGGTAGDVELHVGSEDITNDMLAPNAVTSDKITNFSVGNADLGLNSVSGLNIQTDAVGEDEIRNDAVGRDEIQTDAVGSSEIESWAVTQSELANNAVTGAKIVDGSVGILDLAAPAVSTSRIYPNAVTADKIFDEPGLSRYVEPEVLCFGPDDERPLLNGSITVPAAGYIIVRGDVPIVTRDGYFAVGVDPSSAAWHPFELPEYGMTGASNDWLHGNATTERVFYVSGPGTYTYYMRGRYVFWGGNDHCCMSGYSLRMFYVPTSYGTVMTTVSAAEADQFESADPVTVTKTNPDGSESTSKVYKVDLRELERRAAAARSNADRLEQELEKARQAQQEGK